jgi:hypothetical protein
LCSRVPFVPLAPSLGAQDVNKILDSPYLTSPVLLQLVACNSTSIDVRMSLELLKRPCLTISCCIQGFVGLRAGTATATLGDEKNRS